jgi:hypothetical protein
MKRILDLGESDNLARLIIQRLEQLVALLGGDDAIIDHIKNM